MRSVLAATLVTALGGFLLFGCQGMLWEKIGKTEFFTTIRDEHQALDPATKTWAGAPALPQPNAGETGTVGASGRLYVLAGGSAAAYRYDAQAGTWEFLPSLPEPRGGAIAVSVSRTVVVASGVGPSGPVAFIEALDEDASPVAWTRIAAPARAEATVVATGTSLFLVGGRDEAGTPSAQVWELTPVTTTSSWVRRADLSTPRVHAGGFALAGRLHVVSGHDGNGVPLETEDVLDLATGAFVTTTAIPTARIAPQAVVISGRAFVYDARVPAVGPTGRLDSFTAADGWTSRAPHPRPLAMASLALSGSQILVAGGATDESDGQSYLYDPGADTWTQTGGMVLLRHGGLMAEVGGKVSYVGGYETEEEDVEVDAGDFLGFPF